MTKPQEVRYTLLADGGSDKVLLHHLSWLLRLHSRFAIQPTWADLSRLPRAPRNLAERIKWAMELYPCDLLFFHRDAERDARENRMTEIHRSLGSVTTPTICVVPVHMQEAWLLFDEHAIRRAAGNPNGRERLMLPRLIDLEALPDPKKILHELLAEACGLGGRRRKQFSPHQAAHLIPLYISDFSPLRVLPAFKALDEDVEQTVRSLDW